ncbi:hypothetical protein D3C71_1799520 [compost metagenome]
MFAFDLYGYGMMAMSTLLMGIAMINKDSNDKLLKIFFMVHGIFVPVCSVFPTLNIFSTSDQVETNSSMGTIALQGWCIYFFITTIFIIRHFKKSEK